MCLTLFLSLRLLTHSTHPLCHYFLTCLYLPVFLSSPPTDLFTSVLLLLLLPCLFTQLSHTEQPSASKPHFPCTLQDLMEGEEKKTTVLCTDNVCQHDRGADLFDRPPFLISLISISVNQAEIHFYLSKGTNALKHYR